MSSTITPTALGVNNTSPSYALHVTGSGSQLGTLLISTTNATSTSTRAEIAMHDSNRSLTVTNNGTQSFQVDSSGRFIGMTNVLSYVASSNASASTSTTNVLTFPSAGVYFLLVSQSSGSASNTIELTDNLTRVFMVVVSSLSSSYTPQIYSLGNSSTGFFNVTSGSSQYSINLVVNSGSYTYRMWYHKIF